MHCVFFQIINLSPSNIFLMQCTYLLAHVIHSGNRKITFLVFFLLQTENYFFLNI